MGLCSPPALQIDTSIPQILPETQNSYGLAEQKRKDNFTATTTATAHCHVPEGHLQSPIPEMPSWAYPRPHMCKYEWIANKEFRGLK